MSENALPPEASVAVPAENELVSEDEVVPDFSQPLEEGDEDEALAYDPTSSLNSGEGEVIDVGTGALVARGSVMLAEQAGEWVKGDTAAPPASAQQRRQIGDLYRAFAREATRLPRLNEEEERAFGLRVRDHGDKNAAKKLVVHNLRLAMKMAHQYRRSWTNIMDLVQEASAGMTIAAQRWDPDQGTRFGTYAAYWMRAQLTKFLMTNGRMIHTANTRAGRKLYFQLPRIRRQLVAAGEEPSVGNIAREIGENEIEVARVINRLDGREASLDAKMGEDNGTLGDLIEGNDRDPEDHSAQNEIQALIGQLTAGFSETLTDERDLAIWNEHLIASSPTSLVALGKRFGVSKQRMGQLATRLKRKFRCHVIDELGPQTELGWLFES